MAKSSNLQIVITGDAMNARKALADLDRALGRTDKQAKDAGRSVGGSFDGIGSKAMAAGAAVAAGGALIVGAAATWGLQVAAANEQAATSFEVLLGSATEAQDFLGEMRTFAASTPFELTDLNDYAARLIAVGTEAQDVEPIMTNLGNAAAGMGKGAEGIDRAVTALGQMRQSGRVALEEINQLTEAGIPIIDALADKYGVAGAEVRQMATDGKIAVQDVFDVIENGSGPAFEKFSGMMEAQSKTLTGVLSNLKDTLGQSLAEGMQPVLEGIVDVMPRVMPVVEDLIESFQPLSQAVADFLPMGVDFFRLMGRMWGPVIEAAGGFLGDLVDDVQDSLAPMMVELENMVDDNAAAFVDLVEAAEPMIPVVGDTAAAVAVLVTELNPLLPMLTVAAETLGVLAEVARWTPHGMLMRGIASLGDDTEGLNDNLGTTVERIQESVDAAADADTSYSNYANRMELYGQRIAGVDSEIADVTKQLDDAKKALDDALTNPMGERFDDMTDPLRAQMGVMDQMSTAFETFRDNAEGGLNFDANSGEGRQNLDALLNYAEAIWANSDSLIEQTGNTEDAENAAALFSDQLSTMLSDMGVSQDEIDSLLGSVGLVPDQFQTAFQDAQTEINDATGAVMILTAKLAEMEEVLARLRNEPPGTSGDDFRLEGLAQGGGYTQGASAFGFLGFGARPTYGQPGGPVGPPSGRFAAKPMNATKGGTVINANFHGVSVKAAMAELAFQERRAW